MVRALTATKAYQRSSVVTEPGQRDPRLFARMAVKGLTGEQLFDSLAVATEYQDTAPVDPRPALLGAAGALVLVAVLFWPIGVVTGGESKSTKASNASQTTQGTVARRTTGIAVIAERDGRRQLAVQATLPPSQPRQAYEVWLYNSQTDAKSLGAQVTDARGVYQGAAPLPSDFQRYRFIDISRERIDRNAAHSGDSVLRGPVPKLRQPSQPPRKGQSVILGQVVLQPVSGG
jgi:hypothetical protein